MRGSAMRKVLIAAALSVLLASASLTATDYLTEGGDAARSGWLRKEKGFTPTNVRSTRLVWKVKLDSAPREMHNLVPPLIVEKAEMSGGAREVAVVAGVSNTLFAIDAANGAVLWETTLE